MIRKHKYMELGICFLLLSSLFNYAGALYEDQIKKFDWRTFQIGALVEAQLLWNDEQQQPSSLLVRTRENVLASLNPRTGELLWRQVLELAPRGDLKLMHYLTLERSREQNALEQNTGASSSALYDVLTVQGHAPALVRGWHLQSNGHIDWEWSLMPLQPELAENAFWIYSQGETLLHHVMPVWQSHLEITQYRANTGQVRSNTVKLTTPWIQKDHCIVTGVHFVCLNNDHDNREVSQLISIDVTSNSPKIYTKTLDKLISSPDSLQVIENIDDVVLVNGQLVTIKEDSSSNEQMKLCNSLLGHSNYFGYYRRERILLTTHLTANNMLKLQGYSWPNCSPILEVSNSLQYPEEYGQPVLKAFDCKDSKRDNNNNEGGGNGCLYILATEDDSILAIQKSRIRWVRDEALANVVASEFIDLPVVDDEGALENEIKSKTTDASNELKLDIGGAFVNRLITQSQHLKSVLFQVLGLGPKPSDSTRAGLIRDAFGLHKMLVILTKSGKVFGIDNISGKHHWRRFLPNLDALGNGEDMRLLVLRTNKFFPLQAICTIIAKNKVTGNGIMFRFDPISGKPIDGGLMHLNYRIKQMGLLPDSGNDYVSGLLLLDQDNNVHVYPPEAAKKANQMYLFTVDKGRAYLNGYHLLYTNNNKLHLHPTWNVDLSGANGEHRVIKVASKNLVERVHSQGRVLPDRSVLYKYVNPNLVAVFTESQDPHYKTTLTTHLIDVVSGSVVFSMLHRRVKLPIQVVHSENWLAYSYYNEKVRRTEITTVELYEGKSQTNSTYWSSLNGPPIPLVERQTYIFPSVIHVMRETITVRGITNKDILIGTAKGSIIEMPWTLLDPRRSSNGGMAPNPEEMVLPYIPELAVPTENTINYNQSIPRLHFIHTAPSSLESTCLVVAAGLDVFVTRVAPSKTFDLLKEDFDYFLITIVLVVLTGGSVITKHLASRKQLKQAWR